MAIINEKTGSVKLVKGKATIRYKLTEPLPVVNNLVKCTVNAPIGTAKTLRVPSIVIPEVFVLSLKRISDSVVVTITSTIPNSTTSLSINIDESRDGSPNRVPIGNVTHPVTLVNGVGTLTYAIRLPNPTTAGRVSVKILDTNPLVTQSVNVAAYVPPVTGGDIPGAQSTGSIDIVTTGIIPRSGSLQVKITWDRLSPNYGTLHPTIGFRGGAYMIFRGNVEHGGQRSGSSTISIPYTAPDGATEIYASFHLGAQTWPDGSSASGPGVVYTRNLTLAP